MNMSHTANNFLRIVSHELKTPVTAMTLQLNLLETDPGVRHTAVLDRGLERITRTTRHLLDLLDTMIEWVRVEEGGHHPELAAFDLAELTEEVVGRLASQAQQRNTEVRLDLQPRRVVNDRRLVRLVVINLVERAIAVSPAGPVRVRMADSAHGCRLSVSDRAPTMSEEQWAEVYDPIRYSRDLHRDHAARSGLGLFVTCGLARAVGGEVRWEGHRGSGNTFVFDVPSRVPSASGGALHEGQRCEPPRLP